MKLAGIAFIILGFFALIHTIFTMVSNSAIGRGGNLPFLDNGSAVVAVMFFMAGATLLYVYREKRVK
jgi:uncharacterized membrane protein